MEYRDAVIKAADTIRKDGSLSVIDVADALVEAYNAGRAEPLDLSPDERIVSAQAWEAFQCWQRDAEARAEFEAWRALPSRGTLNGLMADRARMNFLANLANDRIYSATFSRSNICLTLRDGCGFETFRDCVDAAIKEAVK